MKWDGISDQELQALHGTPYNLYKWKCSVRNCPNGTKIRLYNIAGNQLLREISSVMIYTWFGNNFDKEYRLFAWIRSKPRWISEKHNWYICGKHGKVHKHFKHEIMDFPNQFILLKDNQVEEKKYTLIEKIEKRFM